MLRLMRLPPWLQASLPFWALERSGSLAANMVSIKCNGHMSIDAMHECLMLASVLREATLLPKVVILSLLHASTR